MSRISRCAELADMAVDPDEMAHNELSHLDLHCLQRYMLKSAGLKELINACQQLSLSK